MFDMLFRTLPYFIMRGSKIKFDDFDNFELKRKKSSDDEVPYFFEGLKNLDNI